MCYSKTLTIYRECRIGHEGESGGVGTASRQQPTLVQQQQPIVGAGTVSAQQQPIVGAIPVQQSEQHQQEPNLQQDMWGRINQEQNPRVYARRQIQGEVSGSVPRWTTEQEEQLKVYSRKRGNGVAHQGEQRDQPLTEQQGSVDVISISSDEDQAEGLIDGKIALRRTTRATAGIPAERYGFNVNDIANYVSYEALSPAYKAFVASLQSVSIPTDWKKAKEDSKWYMAMVEELEALCKNKTWVITPLPLGKKVVNCKWVYTMKQNAEGKIERYKARLVTRVYNQTYDIDYDETFAPVAKMNTMRILISCVANF